MPLAITQNPREDFPFFKYSPDTVYLDSAASNLVPEKVIQKEVEYLEKYPANIARGLYPIAERATIEYGNSRKKIADWINATPNEIIFTSGTTESLNLLSFALESLVTKESSIATTVLDHHSNFLPWLMLARRSNASFRTLPISEDGEMQVESLQKTIDRSTKIVAFPHVSNVTGAIAPVAEIAKEIRRLSPSAIIVLDAAQSAAHFALDVRELGVDFIAFSGHKCFGPKGIGILWGRENLLDTLPAWKTGGGMVEFASENLATFRKSPARFEAGTPNIGGAIALGTAVEYIQSIGMKNIRQHEEKLTQYAENALLENFRDIDIFGPKPGRDRGPLISFSLPNIHPHDIASFLGTNNICVRAGSHCAQPLHASIKKNASVRMSFSIYNLESDIDRTVSAIAEAREKFSKK